MLISAFRISKNEVNKFNVSPIVSNFSRSDNNRIATAAAAAAEDADGPRLNDDAKTKQQLDFTPKTSKSCCYCVAIEQGLFYKFNYYNLAIISIHCVDVESCRYT